ncbi:MAG: flavodoxin family protein [Candidatus Heimdallarchaeota archaeon]|nr:flavodoxin family protein [Candidatus Heimdallarchaeota archaeon]MCK4878375.1 flavodoxin family protein [Candidatus Heimdallarchaeota archaeon]
MSYLILNGMYQNDSIIPKIDELVSEEFNKRGIKGETIVLQEKDIKPCLGCFKCWIQTPGICIIDDYGREVAKKIIQADNLIYLTPVHFGGYSSELKKAVDRSLGLLSPFFRVYKDEIHHETRYDKYPNLFVIGTLKEPNPKQEEIFSELVKRNVLNNFAPKHATQIIYFTDEISTIKKKIEEGVRIVGDDNE